MILQNLSNIKYNPLNYILAADDDEDDQELLRDALQDSDFDVEKLKFVTDGEQLMNALQFVDNLPNLILLDLNMPRKNGREALAEIKSNALLRHIPVIIFSTSDASIDIKDCHNLGSNAYIIKPNNYDDLVDSMRTLLDYWIGHSHIAID